MRKSNDNKITFDPESHVYKNKDKRLVSVTTFISKFKNEFDGDFFSKKIALRDGRTQADVLAEWSEKAKRSCEIGTAIHKIFEDYVNGDYSILNGEIQVEFMELDPDYFLEFYYKSLSVIKFIKDFFVSGRLTPVYTEHIVYNDFLAGQIDMICKDAKDNYYILDFKTNKTIDEFSYNKKMKHCLLEINDSNFYHYSLQLSIYKKLFKEKDILATFIVHVTNEKCEFIRCDDILELVPLENLINDFQANITRP